MYRGASPPPIFDVPELPQLRRVKPLPKRRRTSNSTAPHDVRNLVPAPATLGPDATAEELIAHADSLSAHMALQSYYMPILGGVQDLFKNELGADGLPAPVDFSAAYGAGHNRGAPDEDEIGDDGHLQQPGNTKKRKVPANAHSGKHGADAGGNSGGEEEPTDKAIPTGGRPGSDAPETEGAGTVSTLIGMKSAKLSTATRLGLQRKEMLKNRKRQLGAVLGTLPHGDTLALDKALSTNYPFINAGFTGDSKQPILPKVRLSKRRGPRLARARRELRKSLPAPASQESIFPTPECEFSFECHSATSDRLITTNQEVAVLHARFKEELAQQAAKAEEAKQAALASNNGPRAKRTDRTKQKARTGAKGGDQTAQFLEPSAQGTKKGTGGKKKKRSALANASNPHHLRNYVPSRLPHSGQANAAQANLNAQNYLGPPPVRFLSAEIPPRRRKKSENTTAPPPPQLTNPADEWICPFCEYDLFYGDQDRFRRAVRSRKKILRRRRKARERAAAAASGKNAARAPEKGSSEEEEGNPGYAASHEEAASTPGPAKGKSERDRDKAAEGGGSEEHTAIEDDKVG